MNNKENNILIAEFMGKEIYHKYHESFYDVSWSWLMPVVEKIESIDYKVEITLTETEISGFEYCSTFYSNDSKIHSTYTSVLEFIKWYNGQK